MRNEILKRLYPTIIFVTIGFGGLLVSNLFRRSICLFRFLFGIPCPACGMTRAYISLFRGDIEDAFWYHPLFWVPVLICVLSLFDKLSERMIYTLAVLVLVVWVIRMIFLFPNQIEPMILDERGIVPIIFEWLWNR